MFTLDEFETVFVNQRGDTMHGDLNMNNFKITNIPTPKELSDVVNREYVDTNSWRKFSEYQEHIMKEMADWFIDYTEFKIEINNAVKQKEKITEIFDKDRIPKNLNKIFSPSITTEKLNMSHNRIINVGEPKQNEDAVNLLHIKKLPKLCYTTVNLIASNETTASGEAIINNRYSRNGTYMIRETGELSNYEETAILEKVIIIISVEQKTSLMRGGKEVIVWGPILVPDFASDNYTLIYRNVSNLVGMYRITYIKDKDPDDDDSLLKITEPLRAADRGPDEPQVRKGSTVENSFTRRVRMEELTQIRISKDTMKLLTKLGKEIDLKHS
jgi:hypothetical protein